jgi:hypothetical protein
MWREEWWEHPWNRFAAVRWMDSLVRAGRLREARRQVARFQNDGSEEAYFRHLDRRLPPIIEILDSPRWRKPTAAMASRNDLQSGFIHDGLLETQWSTRTPQKRSDWLELATDPSLTVRGVTLLSIPYFGHGPAAIELLGRDAAGELVDLGRHDTVTAPRKGWITMRFPARRLERIRITLLRDSDAPWTVSEARWLVAEEED